MTKKKVNAFQWNREAKCANELKDLGPVRNTCYDEVHDILGTSGCSNVPEMWTWMVLGVLETRNGKLIVNPRDWVVTLMSGVLVVMTDAEYNSFYRNA